LAKSSRGCKLDALHCIPSYFKVQAFKSPSIVSPEKLYSMSVLKELNQQELPLKDELSDNFIFC
jgi:hypothetical protein